MADDGWKHDPQANWDAFKVAGGDVPKRHEEIYQAGHAQNLEFGHTTDEAEG